MHYTVITTNGSRDWDADDAEHALEQHRDAFPVGDDGEDPIAVLPATMAQGD